MRTILLTIVITAGLAAQVAQAVPMAPVELYTAAGLGPLVSGNQRDIPDVLIAPTPESYGAIMGAIGARYYPVEQIGIEGGPKTSPAYDDWLLDNHSSIFFPIDQALGWYNKVGLAWHFDRIWFLDVTALYLATRAAYSTGVKLDGNILVVSAGLGVSLP